MKMFKRFAAALLAGVMVLAMLTACGGNGGGGAPVAPVTRDEALEKSVAEWTVEWGKSKNLELTVDDSLTAMSDKCLPAMVKIYDAQDQNASIAAQNELKNAFVAATNGKKVAPVDVFIPNTMEFTKENVMNVVQNGMGNIQTILTKAGVNNPTKFGVTVTKQKDYTLIFFMISE
jgi:hypothetical protein